MHGPEQELSKEQIQLAVSRDPNKDKRAEKEKNIGTGQWKAVNAFWTDTITPLSNHMTSLKICSTCKFAALW